MRYLVLLFLVGLALVGCGSAPNNVVPQPTFASPTTTQQPEEEPLPKFISIPEIRASSIIIETGLNPDKTIETPPVSSPLLASWYVHSPRPGAVGPAIVLGHVDGEGQRGIFYRLKELKPGSLVVIEREDGSLASFEVYKVATYPKKDFPTDLVYGDTLSPEIRLITCGGTFGNAEPGHYDDNVIAFGKLTS